ncbi:hypothetical protein AB0N09_21815 [Streptomyces erythrochromogenes]|uniref:DUF6197 family protein n=1 Tax=Streptomyces erythrochromogenes TaxID=285574 RepID=UPI00343D57FD
MIGNLKGAAHRTAPVGPDSLRPDPRAVQALAAEVEAVYAAGPTGYPEPTTRLTLRTARELIIRYGWTRGTLCDRNGLCLLGAVRAAALPYDPAVWKREVLAAEARLMATLGTRDPHGLPRFNNAQTWAGPVLDLLLRAAH